MNSAIEQLMRAVVQAPSGDNTQPWRFDVDSRAKRVDCFVDESRDVSPMNLEQRMARIAVGAALENLLLTAERCGWAVRQVAPPAGALAAVAWEGPLPDDLRDVPAEIFQRVTNRRPYDARLVPDEVLAELRRETPELEGVTTHWISGRERIAAWAEIISEADARMFGEPSMRAAFLSKVRFDAPVQAEVDEGLCLASLEVSAPQRGALRLMRIMPDWLLKLGGARRVFAAAARKLVTHAAGLCVVAAPDDSPRTDLLVGRAMQRAWLTLAAHGLAAQPMMSLMVLDNALEHGSDTLIAALGRPNLERIKQKTLALLPERGQSRPAFLFRFGYVASPSGRTGRLPLEASVKETDAG
jgi:nitroreductase